MSDLLTIPLKSAAQAAEEGVTLMEPVEIEETTGNLRAKGFKIDKPNKIGFWPLAKKLPSGTSVIARTVFEEKHARVVIIHGDDLHRFSAVGSKVGIESVDSEWVYLNGSRPLPLTREDALNAVFLTDGKPTDVFVSNKDVSNTCLFPVNMVPSPFDVPADAVARPLVSNVSFNPNRFYYRAEELLPEARSPVAIGSALEKLARERFDEVKRACPHNLPSHWHTLSAAEFKSVEQWNWAYHQGWRPIGDILDELGLGPGISSALESVLDAHVPLPGTQLRTLYRRLSFDELMDETPVSRTA